MSNGWIPVSERLPEKGGWVLTTREDGKVDLGHWFFNEGWKEGHNPKVIAWQPLPEPYRESAKMTNYELLKNMSVEEMAVTIMCPNELGMADIKCDPINKNCCKCCLEWLNEESEGDGIRERI